MGKIAGTNAVGDNKAYVHALGVVSFNAMGVGILSVGQISGDNLKSISVNDSETKIYKKLFFNKNALVGGIIIGDNKSSANLITGIEEATPLEDVLKGNLI